MSAVIRMALAVPTRLIILTVCWAALVTWSYGMGYLTFVFEHDVSRLSYVISAVFILALAAAFAGRTSHLSRVETWLVTLGLIGNVVGFLIALQEIDTGSLSADGGVLKVASNLLAGMGVAFCSTLVGAVTALWLSMVGWVMGAQEVAE